MNIINNFGLLLQDLRNNNYHVTVFDFTYNNSVYDVIFEDNDNIDKRKNEYASILLTFINIKCPEKKYTCEANRVKLFLPDVREFREFFNIPYSPHLGDAIKTFTKILMETAPVSVPPLNQRQNIIIDHCLAGRSGHNPNAIYCYDARRLKLTKLGKQMQRSSMISQLTERRKPELYEYFKNDKTVTFYFSANPDDELSDIEIINKFKEREKNRRDSN